MMIYSDSVTGTSIHVNLPQVTPAMIQMAEKAQGKKLVIECVGLNPALRDWKNGQPDSIGIADLTDL
jgi:hypothetical protein